MTLLPNCSFANRAPGCVLVSPKEGRGWLLLFLGFNKTSWKRGKEVDSLKSEVHGRLTDPGGIFALLWHGMVISTNGPREL